MPACACISNERDQIDRSVYAEARRCTSAFTSRVSRHVHMQGRAIAAVQQTNSPPMGAVFSAAVTTGVSTAAEAARHTAPSMIAKGGVGAIAGDRGLA